MKTTALLLALPLLLLTLSCSNREAYTSGNQINEEKAIRGVSRVRLEGVFNLTLSQSDEESIQVKGNEELLKKLRITQEGNLLILELKEKNSSFFSNEGELQIRLSLKELKELDFDGVGNLKSDEVFKVDHLKLHGNGVGNLDLFLEANVLEADFDMVGNIDLEGSANRATFTNNGIGSLDARDLQVKDMDLRSSGIGKVEVYCTGNLSLSVDGIGKVTYTGNPTIVKKEVSGIGKVEEN